jgi:hypothetical protein
MKSKPIGVQNILATDHNTRRDDARGGSFLLAHQQLGALALPTNPTNGQTLTLTVNGTAIVINYVSTIGSAANNVLIQGTAALTAAATANFLRRPDITNANQVAASAPNQQLLQYCGYALPSGGTTITPFSLNKNVNGATANLSTFTASTTVTAASWTAQTLQLFVEDGTFYINGVRYLFTGGSTPTVSAPSSHPRIDVLTIDTGGTLAWTAGSENVTPTAPSYPSNKLAICELYNVVGETGLYDNENQQTSQGYILNDVRPTTSQTQNPTAFASNFDPAATDTYNIGENSGNEWQSIYAKNIYANSILQLGGQNVANAKFGGTGADGALSVTSGATNINLGGAAVFIKNYSSISITGTGYLTFSNPANGGTLIIFRCAGNCTVTSSANPVMDLTGMGGAGGAQSTYPANPNSGGAFGQWTIGSITGGGNYQSGGASTRGGGGGASSVSDGSDGSGGNNDQGKAPALKPGQNSDAYLLYPVVPGSGGGSGFASTTGVNGGGGAGGGSIVFEVAGALNITSAFQSKGVNGGNTSNSGDGGGGGGGGGYFFFIYGGTLTANSATFTTTGGSGGTGGTSGGNGGTGAAGGSTVVKNQVWV